MATSSNYGKAYINGMLRQLYMMGLLECIIDVGAGSGTYKKLMAMDFAEDVEWTAVEAASRHIDEFGLADLYDHVVNEDIRSFEFENMTDVDLVIFGEVLDRMSKDDAITVIDKCLEQSKSVMITLPIKPAPQTIENDNPFDTLVKDDWSHEEIMESFPAITSYLTHNHVGIYFATKNDEHLTFIPLLHKKVTPLCLQAFPDHQITSS